MNQLNIGPNRHKIAKLAVVLAMDRHNPQRELVSQLISNLYSRLLTQDEIARGFDELLVSLDDIRLDTPDAHTVSAFLILSIIFVHMVNCCIDSCTFELNIRLLIMHGAEVIKFETY